MNPARGQGNLATRLLIGIFIWLHKNELDATSRFGIPPNRVVELGARLDLVLEPSSQGAAVLRGRG
ncbi:MAG: putative potassium transport system protein kup [Massilia sp.]|nr:putative potassium transport system protein kup [Massilia sp.]